MTPETTPPAAPKRARVPYRYRVGMRAACALVTLVVLLGSGYAWALYKQFTASVPHGDAVPALGAHAKDLDGAAQNILLLGSDSRAGATRAEQDAMKSGHDDSTVNTDTMMVLHLPADGGEPSVISFPRDSWVHIPGHGKAKLNAAYGDGYNPAREHDESERQAESAGIVMTLRTIEGLTGLHIDHYLQVDLLGFYRISEAIGGVKVCLKHAENAHTDSDAYGSGYSGIDLPKGVSTIEGRQALAFVRQRHGLPHGDLDRIRRQQYFLDAAFSKVVSAGELLNPFKLHRLLTAVSSSLLTDPSLNLLSLARSFESIAAGQISFTTLPNQGPQLIYPDGVETSIVRVDAAAIPAFVRAVIGEGTNAHLAHVSPAAPASVTVDVLNGTSVYLLATRNARQLHADGFHIDVVDSTENPVTATSVLYPPGHAAGAKAVAARLHGAKLVETTSVQAVTLELGSDGKQVTGVARPLPDPSHAPATTAPQQHSNGITCID